MASKSEPATPGAEPKPGAGPGPESPKSDKPAAAGETAKAAGDAPEPPAHPVPPAEEGKTPPRPEKAGGDDARMEAFGFRRFYSQADVSLGLEKLLQMSLLGQLPLAVGKDLSVMLRALGNMLPKDAAGPAGTISQSLRERIERDPSLLADLQFLLTPEQLRGLVGLRESRPQAKDAAKAGTEPGA